MAGELLHKLDAQLDGGWVLITADDAMPEDHAGAIAAVGATVAIVHPERDEGWDIDAWRREVVHRWAHAMHEQAKGTIRRCSLRRHAPWKRRVRRRPK